MILDLIVMIARICIKEDLRMAITFASTSKKIKNRLIYEYQKAKFFLMESFFIKITDFTLCSIYKNTIVHVNNEILIYGYMKSMFEDTGFSDSIFGEFPSKTKIVFFGKDFQIILLNSPFIEYKKEIFRIKKISWIEDFYNFRIYINC